MGLYELNFKAPDQKSRRRYQILVVLRDDTMAEHRIDMGLSKNFKKDQIRIPGGIRNPDGRFEILHTVSELQSMANDIRAKAAFDKRELAKVNKIKI